MFINKKCEDSESHQGLENLQKSLISKAKN